MGLFDKVNRFLDDLTNTILGFNYEFAFANNSLYSPSLKIKSKKNRFANINLNLKNYSKRHEPNFKNSGYINNVVFETSTGNKYDLTNTIKMGFDIINYFNNKRSNK